MELGMFTLCMVALVAIALSAYSFGLVRGAELHFKYVEDIFAEPKLAQHPDAEVVAELEAAREKITEMGFQIHKLDVELERVSSVDYTAGIATVTVEAENV